MFNNYKVPNIFFEVIRKHIVVYRVINTNNNFAILQYSDVMIHMH